jgi:hypothetical protein
MILARLIATAAFSLLVASVAMSQVIPPREMFKAESKDRFARISSAEQSQSIENILISDAKFASLAKPEQSARIQAVRRCSVEESKKPEYERFDMVTVITRCLFRLGYAG